MLLDIVIVQCCSITSTVEQLSLVLDVVEAMMTTDPQEKPRSKKFPGFATLALCIHVFVEWYRSLDTVVATRKLRLVVHDHFV